MHSKTGIIIGLTILFTFIINEFFITGSNLLSSILRAILIGIFVYIITEFLNHKNKK
ncbi:hypothetical protein [Weissella koreensis]|uniref:hypothetical protein n=1 Tax=Weissella koreensis TaxID=165096 RepID=UPI00131A04B8|nr:hypothetical protein [Weissella koreensis]